MVNILNTLTINKSFFLSPLPTMKILDISEIGNKYYD